MYGFMASAMGLSRSMFSHASCENTMRMHSLSDKPPAYTARGSGCHIVAEEDTSTSQ